MNSQNLRRPTAQNVTGALGVSWDSRRKQYMATIKVDGKTHNIGRFKSLDDASAAYIAAKRQLHPAGCL